jgi:hypothetical protein
MPTTSVKHQKSNGEPAVVRRASVYAAVSTRRRWRAVQFIMPLSWTLVRRPELVFSSFGDLRQHSLKKN